MRMRKPRRISLNAFKPTCDLQPYLLSQEQGLTTFQTSMMLMFLLRKHQKLTLQNKQNQIHQTLDHLTQQNQLLKRIQEKRTDTKSKKVLLSSFKVLEQLDLNRKHAYQVLDQQNKQIQDRIYALETALSRMTSCQKSPALNQEYLQKLQARVRNRVKVSERLTKMIEQEQEKYDTKLQENKKKLMQRLRQKVGNKNGVDHKQPKQKSRSVVSFNSELETRSQQLLDLIFLRLGQ